MVVKNVNHQNVRVISTTKVATPRVIRSLNCHCLLLVLLIPYCILNHYYNSLVILIECIDKLLCSCFSPDNGFDDQLSDGLPHTVRVHSEFCLHLAPQSQEHPLVTLADCLISVGCELTILFVDAGGRHRHEKANCKQAKIYEEPMQPTKEFN